MSLRGSRRVGMGARWGGGSAAWGLGSDWWGMGRGVWLLGAVLVAGGCGEPEYPPAKPLSPSTIVRERPGSARVSGLGPILGFANGRDHAFFHCLELVLESCGPVIGYDELMGDSGMAFRTQFRVDKWDVGNSDPLLGEDCLPGLMAAIGWEYEVRVVRRDEPAEADGLRRAIRGSIDRGVPVLATNVIPPEDWGIITGYEREREWLCRSYNGGAEREDRKATGWPGAVVILLKRGGPMGRRDAHLAGIRRGVSLFEMRRSGMYAEGRHAFDEWRMSLRTARDGRYVHANFWTYVCLIDARGAAARFLRSVAREFGGKEGHVRAAADFYDQETRLLLSGMEFVPSGRRYRDSAPPQELRNRQDEILRQAQELEDRAIGELKKAA